MSTAQKFPYSLSNANFYAATLTSEGSKSFVKKFLPIITEYIIHQRTNIDRKHFETFTRNGIIYKAFKKKTNHRLLKLVAEWIKGALDAFDKNYLRQLYLLFCDYDNPMLILESYKFEFTCMNDEESPFETPPGQAELSKSSDELLIAIGSLNVFPILEEEEITIKIVLTYYQDVTPMDYEPPCYESTDQLGDSSVLDISLFSEGIVPLGLLKTGFHDIKCRAKGNLFELRNLNSSLMSEKSEVSQDLTDLVNQSNCNDDTDGNHFSNIKSMELVHEDSVESASVSENFGISKSLVMESSQFSLNIDFDEFVKCVCPIKQKINNIDLIGCSKCPSVEHTPCIGHLSTVNISGSYICNQCKEDVISTPTEMTRKTNKSLFQLSVAYIHLTNTVPYEIFNLLSPEMYKTLLGKLKIADILIRSKDEYKINENAVLIYINKLFLTKENDTKRLLPSSSELEDPEQGNSPILKRKLKKICIRK